MLAMKCALKLFIVAVFFVLAVPSSATFAAERYYAEVVAGCTQLGRTCVNVRSGPGTHYKVVKTVRIGTILEIDQEVHAGNDVWYRVRHDTGLRYPERVVGKWYVNASLVMVRRAEGVQVLGSGPHKATGKKIVVDTKTQMLYAYTDGQLFISAKVSTGIKTTPTPKGVFTIFKKQPSRYMQGPLPYVSQKYYDLPGVPWTMYFTQGGAAIHGTYWHSSFGQRHSNGCVNLPVETSRILYEWADLGTKVIVK